MSTIFRSNPSARRRRAGRRRFHAGYTAVEVLMSMAVLAVGVIGIIATEKVTLASNMHTKNMAIGTRIGEAWLGMLDAEAALWNRQGSLATTTWLRQSAGEASWFRPSHNDGLGFGPAFDALGNSVAQANLARDTRFCVDVRLSPLTSLNTGGGMMRAEVRVFWIRDQVLLTGAAVAPAHACSFNSVSMSAAAQASMFHFVYLSTAVRQVGI
jgi:Tfp pilus assembly protein PilV